MCIIQVWTVKFFFAPTLVSVSIFSMYLKKDFIYEHNLTKIKWCGRSIGSGKSDFPSCRQEDCVKSELQLRNFTDAELTIQDGCMVVPTELSNLSL